MPWRLIGIVLILGVFLVFIGLNLENSCDVSFGFKTIENTPVYLTAFSSFIIGLFCAIPLAISFKSKKN